MQNKGVERSRNGKKKEEKVEKDEYIDRTVMTGNRVEDKRAWLRAIEKEHVRYTFAAMQRRKILQ